MDQNTESWVAWRQGGIGSSDAPVVMGVSPWKTPFKLWLEKLGRVKEEELNWAITHKGHEMEPKARASFELEMMNDFPPTIAQHKDYEFLIASLDGFNEELNAVLEIKCPGEKDHKLALDGKVPDKYWPQVQHQLLVTGASCVFYYSYFEGSGVTIEVRPDKEYINELFQKEQEFWQHVTNKTPPPLSDLDVIELDDDFQLSVAEDYEVFSNQLESLKTTIDELKTKMLEFSTHPRVKIGNVYITRGVRSTQFRIKKP